MIIWWHLQMETFSALLALCEGKPLVTSGFPHKGQRGRASMFSLICTWTNVWANNQDASDLRRHCTHYDVTVMIWCHIALSMLEHRLDYELTKNISYLARPHRVSYVSSRCQLWVLWKRLDWPYRFATTHCYIIIWAFHAKLIFQLNIQASVIVY